jgi:predicted enzyme related to lactoylglutathione lyase
MGSSFSSPSAASFTIVDLNFMSVYVKDYDRAIEFYSSVFGVPSEAHDKSDHVGWQMGRTWFTVLPARGGLEKDRNPCNAEFAIQVSAVHEVDALFQVLIREGAKHCMPPEDTEMYDKMRFCCVDDPFGVRIDVYCPIASS